MPEEPQGGGTAGGEGGAGAGDGAPGSNDATGPDGKPWDPDRAMETIKTLREELKSSKSAAEERDELARKVAEFEKEKLSETEKLQKERDEALARAEKAEGALSSSQMTTMIEAAAAEFGAKSGRAGAVARLIDRSAVETDKDGKPTNLKALVEAARKEAPELFDGGRPTGSADGGARDGATGESMNDRIRRMAGRT